MAAADLTAEQTCFICYIIYNDPFMLECGHSICKDCFQGIMMDTSYITNGIPTCPKCQTHLQDPPVLLRNMDAENPNETSSSSQQIDLKSQVLCSYCLDFSELAVRTCLHCDASLCELHLRIHNKSAKHVLVHPAAPLENRRCSVHQASVKYVCTEDGAYMCMKCCIVGEHKDHKVENINTLADEKKKKLKDIVRKIMLQRDYTEKRLQSIQSWMETVKMAIHPESQVSDHFSVIRNQLGATENDIVREVNRQRENIFFHKDILEFKERIEGLSRKIKYLEGTCDETDPLTVLQNCKSLHASTWDKENGNTEDIFKDEEDMGALQPNAQTMTELGDVLISISLQKAFTNILTDLRKAFGAYADIWLDVDTAANNVAISFDLRKAWCTSSSQLRADTLKRFGFCQVLSLQNFMSGQHYWEVETSESGYWRVGVAYPGLEKKGYQCLLGQNDKSWCMQMNDKKYHVIHGSKRNPVYPEGTLKILGLHLNYTTGQLSFYQLCDSVIHLHTFTATFIEPLYGAFFVGINGWVRIRSAEKYF
ncbi:hypothetical protein GDO86_005432 [Hymenochirus boettgeri]|uniref:Uncharacterized protein n=1 Tax=Hymenochirus boettgeri TaxID=247094 RepID=A0A8T2J9T7_9PIPI|nr:hypothetical protein GDO86_005432 [Hymenochirus boettgeri]